MRKSFLLVTVLYLKAQTADISDLNIIKTLVLGGYISQPDEDFIHTIGKNNYTQGNH